MTRMIHDSLLDVKGFKYIIPDLFISFGGESRPAFCCFVEIKRDGKADYTAHQIRFHKRHPGCVYRIETVDEAIRLAQWIRARVKQL